MGAPTQTKPATAAPYQPTAEELRQIRSKTAELETALKTLVGKNTAAALLADVEVYHKAAVWIVRYPTEEFYSKRYVADTLAALDHGLLRTRELTAGRPSWPTQTGQLIRAYRSRVDDSVQPYGLAIATSYSSAKPARLDVVLHGRGATLNEVSFIASHDSTKPAPPEQDGIRLDVYGRGNNAYRWAGETDVFEAIESVRQRYNIDARRIVLRGFSMGGAGAWHIGLHHPDRWAAVEAGAGFTETKRYAKTGDLPAYQDDTLHIYDALDYALNALNVPIIGYGGEDDGQLQGSTNIREQLMKAGYQFKPDGLNWTTTDLSALFLVGPKTGHKFHPDSKLRSDQFIQSALGKDRSSPDHLRFVTHTTRYNQCFWLQVDALEKHYAPAEVDARRSPDRLRYTLTTRNAAQLTLTFPLPPTALTVDGKDVPLPIRTTKLGIEKQASGWKVLGTIPTMLRKEHNLQGPIDDAFSESFLCVRPTGTPNNQAAHAYALKSLGEFTGEFARWMRGDVRVKEDTAVTPADIANHHLVLFGDPGSNKILARIAERLPIRWTKDQVIVGDKTFTAADHVLTMIFPNPLNPKRYVVINSGHTFHEKEFRSTNALLFPRLGDYAVLQVGANINPTNVVLAGLFGERWELATSR